MLLFPLNINIWAILCSVSYTLVYLVFLSGAGFGGQTQLTVSRTGRQQLSLLQPLWQLPPLLLVSHGRDGWTQDQHAEEKTVRLLPSSISQSHSEMFWDFFVTSPYFLNLDSVFFFAAATFCWSWLRRREIMLETSAWWWRWVDALPAAWLVLHYCLIDLKVFSHSFFCSKASILECRSKY